MNSPMSSSGLHKTTALYYALRGVGSRVRIEKVGCKGCDYGEGV